ncbi:MAG: M4 family metallopeptidase [Paludibacteraceae bacterium]|nr:M4 family metallopeptidase [Paludibacteraceae bacterium]
MNKNTDRILLVVLLLLLSIDSYSQMSYFEQIPISSSISIDDWISAHYGVDVNKYETTHLMHRNMQAANNNTTDWQHFTYRLKYNNIPLEFCQINVHKKDGYIVSVNGERFNNINVSTTPGISETTARNAAINYIDADLYSWQTDSLQYFDSIGAPELKSQPVGELVICPTDIEDTLSAPRLAYKFNIVAIAPEINSDVYVDAQTGAVLYSLSNICEYTGTAETRYSGTQPVETIYKNSKYYLHDHTRCNGNTSIYTYSLENHSNTVLYHREITDNDNNWTSAEMSPTGDDVALDAHWAAAKTIDYFYEKFGRKSYNDNNKTLKMYVHWLSYKDRKDGKTGTNNAQWNGFVIKLGDGDGIDYNPYVSIDVVAHEFGHAVTQYSAGLIYKNEPGAINESLSDIWGACVKHYAAPSKKIWWHDYESRMDNKASRFLKNPRNSDTAYYVCPNMYKGISWKDYNIFNDNGGVHWNSGVMNYWFYLLTEGGSGTNDKGDSYDVTGVGFDKSEQIVYKALTDYFTMFTDYSKAALYTREAAIELYGMCSNEARSVVDAWNAVGINIELNIDDILHITQTIESGESRVFCATDSIYADNTIEAGSNVEYKSGRVIHLGPGFRAEPGSNFHAYIEPCTSSPSSSPSSYLAPLSMPQYHDSESEETQTKPNNDIQIYPIPCTDKLNIQNLSENMSAYKIYDVHGKLIKVGILAPETTCISTTDLKDAIYIISISNGKNILYKKFIKE